MNEEKEEIIELYDSKVNILEVIQKILSLTITKYKNEFHPYKIKLVNQTVVLTEENYSMSVIYKTKAINVSLEQALAQVVENLIQHWSEED